MASIPEGQDEFAAAEAELTRGTAWRFRAPDAPNPLTIRATGWSSGHTKLGDAEFLNGVDRAGSQWSVLVGSKVLSRRLIDGEVSEWDEDAGGYVTAEVQGRVEPGEIVSLRFKGDKESGNGYTYPDFDVVRRRPGETPTAAFPSDDRIPY